jgi:ABC-type multidrug transport system fused ATPase/permease subunit
MSEAAVAPQAHPIALIDSDDLRRSRLTVFFRILLAVPHLIVWYVWSIVAEIAVLFAWLVALFTGRVPEGLHNFLAGYVRYSTRVNAYILLMANPWPPFSGSAPYPLDVSIAPAGPQSRITVFFRILLAIPAFVLSYVFRLVNTLVAVLTWFYALFTGRASEGMKNLSVWLYRYEVQTYAYVFLLTGKYPSLSDAPRVPVAATAA